MAFSDPRCGAEQGKVGLLAAAALAAVVALVGTKISTLCSGFRSPEQAQHGSNHLHEELRGLEIAAGDCQDAHELAHASDIPRRLADRNATSGQIVMFGLTGGLIPCPASVAVLLLCLQLKEFTLGATLVACFSIGLALTFRHRGRRRSAQRPTRDDAILSVFDCRTPRTLFFEPADYRRRPLLVFRAGSASFIEDTVDGYRPLT